MYSLIALIPLIPLIGFLINGLFGKYLKKEWLIGTIASASVGFSFILAILIFFNLVREMPEEPYVIPLFKWISTGSLNVNISYQADQLSILFTLIITGVGFLIHIYSIGYMHGDRSFARFFAYLNLFIFMMLNLVLSSNFLLTFFGWEGVGLCSYLLIGFWYDKKFEGYRITWTGDAANKAFIVNRIGDFGFLIAMFLIFNAFNTLDYHQIAYLANNNSTNLYNTAAITAITLLILLGCTGKSAQIPLAVWLPDAMAGPTPVSALIHAATMVTAGIFLIARNSILFALAPFSMNIVAIVGISTAFFAATIGLVQNDFKKVLAYSTVSQLGFMFAALGMGAFTTGVFHVMTHAFFKALLFLAAGSVIHSMHDEQNIKNMGGLSKYMPITYKTFLIATFAISGIPFFSGFFSKDEILWMSYEHGGIIPWIILATAAFFTAFYMYRLVKLVFHGEERFDHKTIHPHESPKTMTIPLIVLAVLSALGGFLGIPYALGAWFSNKPNLLEKFLEPIFAHSNLIMNRAITNEVHPQEYIFMLISVLIALSAIYLANKFYSDKELSKPKQLVEKHRGIYAMLWNKYRLDDFYYKAVVDNIIILSQRYLWRIFDIKIIDGFVNGTAKVIKSGGEYTRKLQTGIVQNYALLMISGIVIILACLLLIR